MWLVVSSLALSASAALLLVRRPKTAQVDRILVEKGARRLTLWREGMVWKTYRIALGWNPLGHKTEEGDGRTPEGFYIIDAHKPDSDYHLALHISYPNDADTLQALERKVSPGGDIMIHGLRNGAGMQSIERHANGDWTAGCIALTNAEIGEIFTATRLGTPVLIRP